MRSKKWIMLIAGGCFSTALGPSVARADCISATQLCQEARAAYVQCLNEHKTTGIAVCNPLVAARDQACAQADFTCRKEANR